MIYFWFSLSLSFVTTASVHPSCNCFHFYQAKAATCLQPSSPKRCRSVTCSDSLEEHPHYFQPRCHSEKCREGLEVEKIYKEERQKRQRERRREWLKWGVHSLLNTDVHFSHIRFDGCSISPTKQQVCHWMFTFTCQFQIAKEKQAKKVRTNAHTAINTYCETSIDPSIWSDNSMWWRGGDLWEMEETFVGWSSQKRSPSFKSATKPTQKSRQPLSLITRCYCWGSSRRQFIYHESIDFTCRLYLNACTTVFMDCYHRVYLVNMKAKINSRCQSVMQ